MWANAVIVFREARGVALFYGAVLAVFAYASMAVNTYVVQPLELEPEQFLTALIEVAFMLTQIGIQAALMSVCFSRIARRMEGGIWRVKGDFDAVQRFFGLWFLLILGATAFGRLGMWAALAGGDEASQAVVTLAEVFAKSFIVPVGALIIFHGAAGTEEVREGYETLSHHLLTVLVIALVNFGIMLLALLAVGGVPKALIPLLSFVGAARVMYIFSCAWALSTYHRDEYEPDNDFDM